ncbi:cyclopropane fatty acyl phospholipid synthase [bacterium]|nr:cyclopropane fatty acyl phospholipid synthase [bacterium]
MAASATKAHPRFGGVTGSIARCVGAGAPRRAVEEWLAAVDVRLDGARPWDPRIRDERVFDRLFRDGTLGLGEAYVDGWWDCDQLDEMVSRVLRAGLEVGFRGWRAALAAIRAWIGNQGRRSRAFEIGRRHYDLGNDLFAAMLDRRMTYSCAYWKDASDLDAAQEAKLDLICRKLSLRSGMRVLDIGCGWGSFAIFAAQRYGVQAVGVTVSEEQRRLAEARGRGLPVTFRLQDYRDLAEPFDAVVSIGMFEHVGAKNYRTYFDVVRRCLRAGGLFLLHSIGGPTDSVAGDPWISRYIFPNSHLPSVRTLCAGIGNAFVIEDWHNFGADYDRTLLAWERNVVTQWPALRHRYDQRFLRTWRYYLLSCAGAFRARRNQLWQLVLSPDGVAGGYASIR